MAEVRIPIVGSPSNRSTDSSKDQRFINCFPEAINNPLTGDVKYSLLKRNGSSIHSNPPGTSGEGRGIATFNGKIYTVIDNILYSNTTAIKTLATSTGAVGFSQFSAANDYLVLLDGTDGYYISTTDVVTEIVDAQFPTPHLPYPVFLDKYLFVQKTTGEIFNCDVGDIVNWSATSYLTPESYPDGGVAIARQNNLLVALGVYSVEFFYDAANPTPGSPLGKNQQAILQYGCASGASIAQEEGLIIFVAQSSTGEKFVVAMEGTKDNNISTEAINRILTGEGSNITDCWGFLTRQKGHLLYILNLPLQARTLVFDLVTKMWHEWDWNDGSTYSIFPMIDSVELNDLSYMLHLTDGKIYNFLPTLFQDNANPIRLTVQTGRYDGDSNDAKFMDRLEIIGDYTTSSSNLSIYWNDNDYQGSWSGPRIVDISKRAFLYRLGSFRRRAFKLIHTDNVDVRLSAFEFMIRRGFH